VLRSEGRRFGLVVDRVINTEEIVVKAVGGQMKAIGLYSGATVLGNAELALILDPGAIAAADCKIADFDGNGRPAIACNGASTANVKLYRQR